MTIYSSKSAAKATTASYSGVTKLAITFSSDGSEALGVWYWQKAHTASYSVRWDYMNASGVWVIGTVSSVTGGTTTTASSRTDFTIPDDAIKVRLLVKPVSTTRTLTYYTSSSKSSTSTVSVSYWTSEWAYVTKAVSAELDAPEVIDVVYKSAGEDGSSAGLAQVTTDPTDYAWALYRYKDGAWVDPSYNSKTKVGTYDAERSVANDKGIVDGHSYKYATRPYTTASGSTVWGDYSDFSDQFDAPPAAPDSLTVTGVSNTEDELYWFKATWERGSSYTYNDVSNPEDGEHYLLRWAQSASYMETDGYYDEAETDPGATSYSASVDEAGRYVFWIKAENATAESGWTVYEKSVALGATPDAPTFGKLPSYVEVGDTLNVSWTHNPNDGSAQEYYVLWVSEDGGETWDSVVAVGHDETSTISYEVLQDVDTTLMFRCRTGGATYGNSGTSDELSDWGYSTAVYVIEPMALSLSVPSICTALPIELGCGSNLDVRQWELRVRVAESYETTDLNGDYVQIAAGSTVWSGTYASGDSEFDATGMTVEAGADSEGTWFNGASYVATLSAVSVYGTSASTSEEFETSWDGDMPEPTLAAVFDEEGLECHLFPACYTDDDELNADVAELEVYRRDGDGSLVLIADGVENTGAVELIDLYPSFGTVTYRVAARSTYGFVGFSDTTVETAYPNIVLQFADGTTSYEDDSGEPVSSSGRIELAYNIEQTETYAPDVTLAEYVGRSAPVAYYGTQRGETAIASGSLVRKVDSDEETISRLRRLASALKPCYYRDPAGLGFWAHVEVSMTRSYASREVSADLAVTRIDGDYAATETTLLEGDG